MEGEGQPQPDREVCARANPPRGEGSALFARAAGGGGGALSRRARVRTCTRALPAAARPAFAPGTHAQFRYGRFFARAYIVARKGTLASFFSSCETSGRSRTMLSSHVAETRIITAPTAATSRACAEMSVAMKVAVPIWHMYAESSPAKLNTDFHAKSCCRETGARTAPHESASGETGVAGARAARKGVWRGAAQRGAERGTFAVAVGRAPAASSRPW